MDLLLDFSFAWISILLMVLLCGIFVLRLITNKAKITVNILNKLNKSLCRHHKRMGIMLILTGFIHGFFSSQSILSLNLGTLAFIVSILLGINWMIRKYHSNTRSWILYHKLITLVFIGTVAWHIVDVGGIQVFKLLLSPNVTNISTIEADAYSTTEIGSKLKNNKYKDGIFSGEATGFRSGLKVSVELKNNQIINITITDHNEVNSRFYEKPIEQIPQAIIDSQNIQVDTVSGATCTSIGIMNAVNNALSKALISGELPKDQDLPQNNGKCGHFHENDGTPPEFIENDFN